MYIPKHYLTENEDEIIMFMQEYSFATIISLTNDKPYGTHLPFVIEKREDKIILTSHFAKANDQWKNIETKTVLVIFSEPHAYISPRYYEKQQNVPTWNYMSVHAYGQSKIITDQKFSFEILEKMIATYDPEYKNQWDSLPQGYKTGMLNGIVPFEITVTELQGKKKLSQNKTANERQNIIQAFEKGTNSNEQIIAKLMKEKGNS